MMLDDNNDRDDDDDDVEHTSVNFRICVRTLFTSSMTLCMHKYHNQEWSKKIIKQEHTLTSKGCKLN